MFSGLIFGFPLYGKRFRFGEPSDIVAQLSKLIALKFGSILEAMPAEPLNITQRAFLITAK